jgi:hypothetical protein
MGTTSMWCVGRWPHRHRARNASAENGSAAGREAMRGREEPAARKGCRKRSR